MKAQRVVLGGRNPDREPFWCGGRPASSAGVQCRAPALLKSGHWAEEEQERGGAVGEVGEEGEELDGSQVSWKQEAGRC